MYGNEKEKDMAELKFMTLELPEFWGAPLVNDDTTGLDADDEKALNKFTAWMVEEYGQCLCVGVDYEVDFMNEHDATEFGVLACNTLQFTFQIK